MGLINVEIRMVNPGDELSSDLNQPWACPHSLLRFANPSLTLASDPFTTPEWSI